MTKRRARSVRRLPHRYVDGGRLPADTDTDTDQLTLTIIDTTAFARAFPQFVELLCGTAPDDPDFVAARSRHMA